MPGHRGNRNPSRPALGRGGREAAGRAVGRRPDGVTGRGPDVRSGEDRTCGWQGRTCGRQGTGLQPPPVRTTRPVSDASDTEDRGSAAGQHLPERRGGTSPTTPTNPAPPPSRSHQPSGPNGHVRSAAGADAEIEAYGNAHEPFADALPGRPAPSGLIPGIGRARRSAVPDGDPDVERGALSAGALGLDDAAERLAAVLETDEPRTSSDRGSADSVILDPQADPVVLDVQPDPYAGGVRVLARVRHGLRDDLVDGHLEPLVQASFGVQVQLDRAA